MYIHPIYTAYYVRYIYIVFSALYILDIAVSINDQYKPCEPGYGITMYGIYSDVMYYAIHFTRESRVI